MYYNLHSDNYRFVRLIISLWEECYFSFFKLYYVSLKKKKKLTKEILQK